MKFSEAMLEGAKLHPQGFYHFFNYLVGSSGKKMFVTCALGAALEAVGELNEDGLQCRYPFYLHWPWVHEMRVCCPRNDSCGLPAMTIAAVVTHLNDHHRWTRERIAGWVSMIEPVGSYDDIALAEETCVETQSWPTPRIGESSYAETAG